MWHNKAVMCVTLRKFNNLLLIFTAVDTLEYQICYCKYYAIACKIKTPKKSRQNNFPGVCCTKAK